MSEEKWDYEWSKYLKLTENFDIFPLQFANAMRIEKNDAVYILDEVGCGKTISAGFIALNYLFNCDKQEEEKNQINCDEQKKEKKKKIVQIVTINSLVKKTNRAGQFLNDWYEKLPFKELGYRDRISICNNHYKNIEKVAKREDIGLLIIDEAHLFLEDTERLNNLKNIKAHNFVLVELFGL